MDIVQINPDELIEYATNPRKNDNAVDSVAASIKQFGFLQPIVIDEQKVIVAGHTRLKAAKKLKLKSVPCVIASQLTEQQIKAFRLIDNRTHELAEWDTELLQLEVESLPDFNFKDLEITFDELTDLIKPEAHEDDFEIPEESEIQTKIKPGDLITIGKHRLLCGDSTSEQSVKSLLNDEIPILMVTDPPYGVEYDPSWRDCVKVRISRAKMGKVTNDNRADWSEVWKNFNSDIAYVWHASWQTDVVLESLRANDYLPGYLLIWNKDHMALGRGDYHWKHEPCWYVIKTNKNHNWQGARDQATVWDIKAREDAGHGHGTQKPIECMARPIKNNLSKGQLVCDPFLGSGTTMVAAHQLNRICYGMELEPKYCQVIIDRMKKLDPTLEIKSTGEL